MPISCSLLNPKIFKCGHWNEMIGILFAVLSFFLFIEGLNSVINVKLFGPTITALEDERGLLLCLLLTSAG